MSNNKIIKTELFDNTVDSFVVINTTKQQLSFFPKEESQMFQGRSYNNLGTRPTGYENDPLTETESNDTRAFTNSIKATDPDIINQTITRDAWFDIQKLAFNDVNAAFDLLQKYRYGIYDIPSSHTPTDYIGSSVIEVPYLLNQLFADFNYVSIDGSELSPLYQEDDTDDKIVTVFTGLQKLRIPTNIFNTILETEEEIEENSGNDIIPNYGKYYIVISPKYIESSVLSINEKSHVPWRYMSDNAIDESGYTTDQEIHIVPDKKRRNIYVLDKDDFIGLPWGFENNPRQSGRLYGSVVEVWDSTGTILKQVKIMTENQFNFNVTNSNFECVLQPDIFGYDSSSQAVAVSDILRIYPRETYFNQFIIEVDYKDQNLQLSNLVSFLVNDTVRDMRTGIFEVYDNNGFTIDDSGQFNGNVINRYQIFQKDRFEARKNLRQ